MVNGCHLLVLSMIACVGCAMCDSSMDNDYAAYGGVRDRIDRADGRVASLFGPAASQDLVDHRQEDAFQPFEPASNTSVDDSAEQDVMGDEDQMTDDLLKKLEELGGKLLDIPDARPDADEGR